MQRGRRCGAVGESTGLGCFFTPLLHASSTTPEFLDCLPMLLSLHYCAVVICRGEALDAPEPPAAIEKI
jgi:hypothetical protein